MTLFFIMKGNNMDKTLFTIFRHILAPTSLFFAFFGLNYITAAVQIIVVFTVLINIYNYEKDESSNAKHLSVIGIDIVILLYLIFAENTGLETFFTVSTTFLTMLTTREVSTSKNWKNPYTNK